MRQLEKKTRSTITMFKTNVRNKAIITDNGPQVQIVLFKRSELKKVYKPLIYKMYSQRLFQSA